MKKLIRMLPAACILACLGSVAQPVMAQTEHLIIDNGHSSYSSELSREHKEQWDDSRTLRNKINTRNVKDFNRLDRAIDTKEACQQSLNLNAYWEPNTLRCLDRQTGRPIQP
ncbi:DUF1283 family protein [Tatumella sp. TA1]|uniref:DUF1283 family protein n=1 Tax=Rosenbergiella collisarenosi TaxID=1544695 RepID=UPI0008F87FC3|nr:DUF1283 family protein [Rosenbergiella collisarenosi]MBT0720827.1 DUF1283 family protein [Rosenbergiella collisarenosi]QGX91458.1 DUF1283 family protein [Tatumella sp. TA1]